MPDLFSPALMWRLGAFTIAALAACGDGGPTGSSSSTTTTSAPASVAFNVVSGETGAPISGATVIVAGATHESDGSGNVAAGAVRLGASVDVLAANYFDRQTLYRARDDGRLALWPMTSPTGLTPEITQRIVYTSLGEDAIPGEVPLRRPPLGEAILVYLDSPIAGDDRVLGVVEDSIGALSTALEGRVEIAITTRRPPDDAVAWDIVINPDAVSSDFIAGWSLELDQFEVVGAKFSFRTVSDLINDRRLLTSMMGHGFGLRDSNDPNDRMYFDWWRRRPNDFSPKEGLIMRLMLQRRAGQRWPDNDRSLGVSGLREVSGGYLRAPR